MTLPNPYVATDGNDVLVYTLDEAASPWANTGSAGALNMTAAAAGPTVVAGLYNNAVNFPGPNNSTKRLYTGAGGTSIGETAFPITVSFFVKLADFGGGATVTMFSKHYRPDGSGWSAPFASIAFQLTSANDGTWKVELVFGGTGTNFVSTTKLTLSTWTHVGFTYDGANVILYQAGVGQAPTAKTTALDYGTHGAWSIGGTVSPDAINGVIDDVRVANVARPASYFQSFGSPSANSAGYYVDGLEDPSGGAEKLAAKLGDVALLNDGSESGASTLPIVTFISPPLGHAVYPYTPVIFTVTDTVPLRRILSRVSFAGRTDLGWDFVHDGDGFGPDYTGPVNSRIVISGGYQYTVLRDGGWPGATSFRVYAVDTGGFEA